MAATAVYQAQGPNPRLDAATSGDSAVTGKADKVLQEAVENVLNKYGGQAEIAISDGNNTRSIGTMDPYPAWSTIKVPIAIAAIRKDDNPVIRNAITSAIRWSDNGAAQTLWDSLGGEDQSSAAVSDVLADGNSGQVKVQTQAETSHYSGFGQTQWSVSSQAAFAAHLPCLEGADFVRDEMGEIVEEQAYGLGKLDGAHFKGGWGPDDDNRYLTRQLGFFDGPKGKIAVAIAVHPADGDYASGQEALTQLDAVIWNQRENLTPASVCETK